MINPPRPQNYGYARLRVTGCNVSKRVRHDIRIVSRLSNAPRRCFARANRNGLQGNIGHMPLETLDQTTSLPTIIEALHRHGGVIIRDPASVDLADAVAHELRSQFDASDESRRTDFSGSKTRRCTGVLRHAPSSAKMIAHQLVLDVADAILSPFCADYQLSSTTGIEIWPGEGEQPLHRDDSLYPIQLPGFELQIGVMWALDDFTAENGATRVVPEVIGTCAHGINLISPVRSRRSCRRARRSSIWARHGTAAAETAAKRHARG